MGGSHSSINERRDLETIVVKYIFMSSAKDVDLIDNNLYKNNTINLLRDILNKYVDYDIIDEIFYHIGGDDNMIEIDLDSLYYIDPDEQLDIRLKCKFLATFYYELFVLFNKIKNLILAVHNLIKQVDLQYVKYQQLSDTYDDTTSDEIELLELKLNRLRLIEINFFYLLGELFVKKECFIINANISLERMVEIGGIIDFEISTFRDKITNIANN